jgi:hypothetical protein
VSDLRPRTARHCLRLVCVLAASLGIAACGLGDKQSHPTSVTAAELDAGNEPYIYAGRVTYQVQISRALNPFATEDSQYLVGVAPDQLTLAPDQLWFGVFLWAKNQTNTYVTTSDTFKIVDSEGTIFTPTPIDTTVNQWAWTAQKLAPQETEPGPDTTAFYGPTQGGLILFKLSDAIYSNRPLTLLIYAPGQPHPSTVSLDL